MTNQNIVNNGTRPVNVCEMIGEAKTFEEYKGAGVYADLLLDRTFKKAFNPDTQNKVCLMTKMPKQYAESAFELLFPVAELAKLSKEEQKMIDEAQKAKWDNYAIKQAAIDSGMKQCMEMGLQQGLQQGKEQAIRELAKKMKAKNMPVEEIMEFTGLTEEEVNAL